jgi:hypothetical protein
LTLASQRFEQSAADTGAPPELLLEEPLLDEPGVVVSELHAEVTRARTANEKVFMHDA